MLFYLFTARWTNITGWIFLTQLKIRHLNPDDFQNSLLFAFNLYVIRPLHFWFILLSFSYIFGWFGPKQNCFPKDFLLLAHQSHTGWPNPNEIKGYFFRQFVKCTDALPYNFRRNRIQFQRLNGRLTFWTETPASNHCTW